MRFTKEAGEPKRTRIMRKQRQTNARSEGGQEVELPLRPWRLVTGVVSLGQCMFSCHLKWYSSQDCHVWLSDQTSPLTLRFREVSPVASALALCPSLLCVVSLLIITWTRERVGFCIPQNAKENKQQDKHKETGADSPPQSGDTVGRSGERGRSGAKPRSEAAALLQPAEVTWEPRAQSGQIF